MGDLKSPSLFNLRPEGYLIRFKVGLGHVIFAPSGWLWVGRGNRSFHSAEAVLRLVARRGRWLASASQMRKIK